MKFTLYISLLFFITNSLAQNIRIDEKFDDWNSVPFAHIDPTGDGAQNGIDFTDLKISNDKDYLYLDINVGREIILQSDRNFFIYIDIDNNAWTGAESYGIGAEILYNFGQREGEFYSSSGIANIIHSHIGLFTAPTVSSDRFEIAIRREFTIQGQKRILGNNIKIVLADEISGGDRLPDFSGGINYQIDPNIFNTPPPFDLNRPGNTDFRIMAYNVLRDDLFEPFLQHSYRRIFQAIQPEIIGFSEIYDNSAAQTAALIESFLPSQQGQVWHFDEISPDIRLVSRYSIRGKEKLDGNGAFHLDVNGKDLVVIVTHLPCCENDNGRQNEVDKIMAFVREAKMGNTSFQIAEGTPFIIMGDKNFVGKSAQVKTLLNGEIVNNSEFGPSFPPDWDGEPFIDANPYSTGIPFTYTWYSSSSSFGPGRLDYMIYSGSALDLKNTFALNTPTISNDILESFNLLSIDTDRASDHLPIIADFSFAKPNSIAEEFESRLPLKMRLFPNPAQDMLSIHFNQALTTEVTVGIYNSNGYLISTQKVAALSSELTFSVSEYPAGMYFVKILHNNLISVSAFVVK